MRRLYAFVYAATVLAAGLLASKMLYAQDYLQATGSPNFAVNIPVPNGFINVSNGNLHLEFSLSSLKQRGQLNLNERLVYDSRIWKVIHYSHYYWWPLNVPNSAAGWRFVKGNETGTFSYNIVDQSDNDCGNGDGTTSGFTSSSMTWTDPSGTSHLFDALFNQSYQCDGSSSQWVSGGYAADASGYQVVDDGNGNPVVKDGAGTEVFPQVIDRYGNYFSPDSAGDLVDDLGRTPVITTVNGSQIYYDVLAPNGPISNNGTRVRYTVTYERLGINTSFRQNVVHEYQENHFVSGNDPNILAIQSIQLPDGSSYQFSYDSYGAISSVVLPTGGIVGYGWTNYTDSYQNVNHWVTSETISGNTTTFTPAVISNCSGNGTGCQEQVTVQRPSWDQTVYTLTLNNGAWNTSTTIYSGAASSGQAKATDQTTYNFSAQCHITVVCSGSQYITKSNEVKTLPDGGIATQTQNTYTNPQSGQVSSVGQWDFYPIGATPSILPTRQTNYTYSEFDLASETHLDQSGAVASSTNFVYTGSATPTSGVVGHGSANAGGPYLTSVVVTNNAPSSTVTTSSTYDDTGALLSAQDANGNPPTSFKYDPTHTFVVETDKPYTGNSGTYFQHITTAAYDPNTGAILATNDENSVALGQAYPVTYSYEPVAGRLHQITYPSPAGGSETYSYPSFNETDVSVAQNASTSVTTATMLDGYGRPYQTSSGGITSWQSYDMNGRPYTQTTPATTSPSSTDGYTVTGYDALNRINYVGHLTGTGSSWKSVQTVGNISILTDELSNQTKQTFNAFGELTSVVEPDPQTGALSLETDYFHDALGNLTCVEQHGNVAGTGCTAPASSDASSPWRVRRFFYNSLSQLRAASIPEHMSLPSSPAQQNCGQGTGGNQWTDCYTYDLNGNNQTRVDNRGNTTYLGYDALNRPTGESSRTTFNTFYYDAGTNGVGHISAESNLNVRSAFGYDVLGRLVSEQTCRPSNCSATALPTTYGTYDLAGNLTQLTYPDGRVVQNSFDNLNRLTAVNDLTPGAAQAGKPYWTATSFAPPGEVQNAQFGNGMQMQAAFDGRQSLTALTYQSTNPSAPQTYYDMTYQWDKNGTNLMGEVNRRTSQQRQFSYDKLNRLVSAADGGMVDAYASSTITVVGTVGSTYVCTADMYGTQPGEYGYISTCGDQSDTGTVGLTIAGCSVSESFDSGSSNDNLASSIGWQLTNCGIPVTAQVNGSAITITATTPGVAGQYIIYDNSQGDLDFSTTSWTLAGGQVFQASGFNQQYGLDNWGNLYSMGSSGFSQSINLQNQVSSFSYDAAGRLLSDSFSYYNYNDDGMMTSSSDGASYIYEADGNRAQVTSGGAAREYYYFAGVPVATHLPGSNTWTDMIYSGGQKIATVTGGLSANPIFLIPDQVGSEAGSVDAAGNELATEEYAPFGQPISGSSVDGYPFAGLERDASGLDHATFRQYSSATGRWTTPDPYDGSMDPTNPQSFNRYTYVGNMPLGFIDPSGLQTVPCPAGSYATICVNAPCKDSATSSCHDNNTDSGEWYDPFDWHWPNISGWFHHEHFYGNLTPRVNTRAPSKDPCANGQLAAAGVNARQQIATAQSYILNSAGPFGSLTAYGVAVNTGGPLDIKNLPGHSPQNPIDVAAGNISFGITCPFGATFCQGAAGLAQGAAGLLNLVSGGRYGHGAPGPASTYFDSPSDNAQIKVGQAMRAAGCHE